MLEENQIQALKTLVDSLTAQGVPTKDIQAQVDIKKAEFLKANEVGKQSSQGQGAPVVGNAAPVNQILSTGSSSANGSSGFQAEIAQDKEETKVSELELTDINLLPETLPENNEADVKATADLARETIKARKKAEDEAFEEKLNEALMLQQKRMLEETGSGDKIANSFTNIPYQVLKMAPNLTVSASVLGRKLLGEEGFKAAQDNAFWGIGIQDEDLLEAERAIKMLNTEMDATGSIIEGAKQGDAGEVVAGLVDAFTSVGSTAITNYMTGGAALFTDAFADSFITINEKLAKERGKAITELREDEFDFWAPAGVGLLVGGLEKVGLNDAGKNAVIRIASSTGGRKILNRFLGGTGEGATEWFQFGLDKYAEATGDGKSFADAATIAGLSLFTQEAAEGALKGFIGGAGMANAASIRKIELADFEKASVALRSKVDAEKIETLLDDIALLNKRKTETTDKEVLEGIEQAIKTKEQELQGTYTNANSILEFASNKDISEINNAQDLAQAQLKRVQSLKKKLNDGDITEDQYANAYQGYIAEYKTQKAKIDGVKESLTSKKKTADETLEAAKEKGFTNLQELYDQYNGNVNAMIGATLTKDAKGNLISEAVENSVFGKQVGKLAESLTKRLFDPITPDARNGVTRQEYKRTIINNAATIVATEKFDPAKQNLDKFLSSRLYLRTNALAKELGIESIQEQGGMGIAQDVTTVKDVMASETAEDTVQMSEDIKETADQPKLASKIKFDSKAPNLFSDTAKKVLSGKLPAVTDAKAFKKELDNRFRTSLTVAMKTLSGTRKVYNEFLKNNWEVLYDAIPQEVINKRFPEFNRAVIDPKTGKQKRMTMQEGTAAGEPVFEKRTDVTQEEFLSYMNAPGSTKAARKNALAETLATQIGFDEVIDALADKEINKKFKDIQELQGFKVPENFEKKVAIIINRLDQFIAKINKIQQENLKAGFVIPELSLQAIKTFAVVLKNGLKAGVSIAKAVREAIKQASEYGIDDAHKKSIVETFNSFEDIITVVSEDANYKKLKSKLDKDSDAAIQRHLQILEDKLRNDISNITDKDQQLDLIYNYLNTSLAVAKDTTSWKKVTNNKDLISYVDKLNLIPNIKSYFEVNNKALSFNGKPITSYNNTTADVRYVRPKGVNKNLKALAKKGFSNILDVFEKKNIIEQQHTFSNDLISKIAKNLVSLESNLGKEFAISYLKIQQLGGESDLRLAGKIRSIQKDVDGDYTYEHTPPVEELIQSLAYAVKNSKNLEADAKDILNKSFVDIISKKDADNLNATGKKIQTAENFDVLNGDSIIRYEGTLEKSQLHFFDKNYNKNKTKTEKENNAIDESVETLVNETIQEVSEEQANSMSSELNKMVERKKGIPAKEIISKATAKLRGAKKKAFSLIIPPSAEDFKGLVYSLLGSGKQGDADMQFFENKIFRPLARANHQLNAERQLVKTKWKNLVKGNKGILKTLKAESEYKFYNNDAAVRVWIWDKLGYEVPGINATDKKGLIDSVQNDPKLLKFAEELISVPNSKESWLKPEDDWTASTIEMDLQEILSKIGRARIFGEYIQNAKIIFSEDNLNKIEAAYGPKYREALEDMLYRIEKGKAREIGGNRLANTYLNWVRGSVAVTMFFNTRSALLQQLSIVNFTNWSDNNPVAQAKLIATKPGEYAKYWTKIFNSDWMKERRQGLKTDINESELAERLKGSKDPKKALLAYALEKGFVMTKYGDNFAVATGGAAFLYNREQTYIKQGLSKEAAEREAFLDFQEIAEQTQQSSRQDLLSNQQVSVIGRLFLAFQNTPMQMSRLTKKAMLDLVNGRGSKVANISKIAYYSTIQNIVFSYLQSALFAGIFGDEDDEEDEKRIDKKTERAINTVIDGFLRGTGVGGAVLASTKNAIIKWYKENDKDWGARSGAVLLELANVSPPIGIKARKIYGAMENYKYNKKYLDDIGYDNPNHPMYGIASNLGSAAFNVPLDRILTKITNIKAMTEQDTEAWQRIALGLGYNTWDLGLEDKEIEAAKRSAKRKKKNKKSKGSPFNF